MVFANTLHPERYHGFAVQAPYFEGWYYKLVSADELHQLAVIPGVYLAQQQENSHAFVQVFDSNADEVRYHRYPLDAFHASQGSFEIRVGPNLFKRDRVSLAIDDEIGQVQGELGF